MRESRDQHFMNIAKAVAEYSACLDKQVGCILVDKNNIIVATGYNGPPRKVPHCQVCQSKENKLLCPAAHAEQNALLLASPNLVHKCYVTLEPCIVCTRMLMNTGCEHIYFAQPTAMKYSGKHLWTKINPDWTWSYFTGDK